MARWSVLPLVALLVAAVVVRLSPPRPAPIPVVERPADEPERAAEPEIAPVESAAPPPVEPKPRMVDELKYLAGLKFHEDVLLAYAEGQGYRPDAEDAAALKAAGLGDRFLGRLLGEAPPQRAEPVVVVPPPPVQVTTTVYAPVEVTVVDVPAPPAPEPAIQTVILCAPHAPPAFQRPAIYREPPFFKTHAFLPTKRLPTAEEVASREASKRLR